APRAAAGPATRRPDALSPPMSETTCEVPFTPPPRFRTPNELPEAASVNRTAADGAPPITPWNGPVAVVPRWTSTQGGVPKVALMLTAAGAPPSGQRNPMNRP